MTEQAKSAHKTIESQVAPEDTDQRSEVIRDTFVLQLKLFADGLRDLALMPVCLLAGVWGLIRHDKNPGRYLYRVLSYGRISERWIGLFDEAKKDIYKPIEYEGNNFEDLLHKTQVVLESKYIDPVKKEKLVAKLNSALKEINSKISPK